jgi:hypothetical protein
MTHPDDARDLYITACIGEVVYWAGERRGHPRDVFMRKLQRYVRGEEVSLADAQIFANALQAITENPRIVPPIPLKDLHERVDCFVDEEFQEARSSVLEEVRA